MSFAETTVYLENLENDGVGYVSNLLMKWNLAVLRETFEENEIGISSLKYLKDSDIKELIPKVGHRCLFCAKLEEWRLAQTENPARTAMKRVRSQDSTSSADGNPPSSIVKLEEPQITESLPINNEPDIIFTESHTLDHNLAFQYNNMNSNEFSVFEWLSHDADGQCILDTYHVVKILGIEQRKTILKTIARWMVDQKLPKSPDVLEQMSSQLMALFPTEHFTSNDLLKWFTQIENGIDPDTINSSIILSGMNTEYSQIFEKEEAQKINLTNYSPDSGKIDALTKTVQDLSLQMRSMDEKLSNVLERLLYEMSSLRKENKTKHIGSTLPEKPFDNSSQFKAFEHEMEKSCEKRQMLTSEFHSINIMNEEKFIRACWRRIITDEIAEMYSWRGTSTKQSIRGMTTTAAIRSAFRQKFNGKDEIFEKISKKHFQYARDRQLKLCSYRKQNIKINNPTTSQTTTKETQIGKDSL